MNAFEEQQLGRAEDARAACLVRGDGDKACAGAAFPHAGVASDQTQGRVPAIAVNGYE